MVKDLINLWHLLHIINGQLLWFPAAMLQYEKSGNLGLVYLEGAESVKRMTSKYKFR